MTHGGLGFANGVPAMMAAAHVAGTVAVLSIQAVVTLRALKAKTLKTRLVSDGAYRPNVKAGKK